MERIQALINQLNEQLGQQAGPAQMLITAQMLEADLRRLANSAAQKTAAVPAQAAASNGKDASANTNIKVLVMMPPVTRMVAGQQAPVELKTPPRPAPVAPASYDPLTEIPTLAHQQAARELNDVIGHNGSSLNDRLKANVLELAAALNDTPVRDLKKAIGVNDRYVFISELFRGDEVMYERSIKTINGFRILPEAEYWMERELKVKLGWDENKHATVHFYQLVKRRFS